MGENQVFDGLEETFGPSVDMEPLFMAMTGVSAGVDAAAEAFRSFIRMRRSELLRLHAEEIGGTTLRNFERALRRSRRNQRGKR